MVKCCHVSAHIITILWFIIYIIYVFYMHIQSLSYKILVVDGELQRNIMSINHGMVGKWKCSRRWAHFDLTVLFHYSLLSENSGNTNPEKRNHQKSSEGKNHSRLAYFAGMKGKERELNWDLWIQLRKHTKDEENLRMRIANANLMRCDATIHFLITKSITLQFTFYYPSSHPVLLKKEE